MTVVVAEKHCSAEDNCVGFTFEKTPAESSATCTAITEGSAVQKVLFKSAMGGSSVTSWCKVLKPASPVGVFFENVQPLTGTLQL